MAGERDEHEGDTGSAPRHWRCVPSQCRSQGGSVAYGGVTWRTIENHFPTWVIKAGARTYLLPNRSVAFDVSYDFKDAKLTTDTVMKENRLAGLLIIKDSRIVLERYGLERTAQGRWDVVFGR